MKVILRIERNSPHNARLTSQFFGGTGVSYVATLLSPVVGTDGKRPRLNLPGCLHCGSDGRKVERQCLAHLIHFGFAEADITIEHKTEPSRKPATV